VATGKSSRGRRGGEAAEAVAVGEAEPVEAEADPVDPLTYGSAITVIVRSCTPQPFAWEPGSHTSTVSFWIHVPMSAA
jgi:hypothetical protein